MRFDYCKANLHTACEEHKYDHCEMCNMARAYQHGYETAQEDMSKNDWIPCSERLPEKDELVLVTVWNDVTIAWRNIYGGWESAEDMYEKGDVTAWMPLPKPYREDGEE